MDTPTYPDPKTDAPERPVVVVDDDIEVVDSIRQALLTHLPRVRVLGTTNVRRAELHVIESAPCVILTGVDPRHLLGYGFLRRVEEVAPAAFKILLSDSPWRKEQLEDLSLLAVLARPPDLGMVVDLVGGLAYGGIDQRTLRLEGSL